MTDEVPESFEEIRRLLREKAGNGRAVERFNDWELMENLRFTNALYNRTVPGEPVSHRRALGRLFRLAKRAIIWMLGWYVNPIVENQHDFNAYATRAINEMKSYLDHLQVNEDILSTRIKRDLAMFRTNLMFLDRELEKRMKALERKIDRAEDARHEPAARTGADGTGRRKADAVWEPLDVLTVMQLVYGSPRELKERQRVYLDWFSGASNALVIGCGRGEFLQLLAAAGVDAAGVESCDVLADYCLEHELRVTAEDPLEHLASRADGSIGAVLITRLTAHYTPARLVSMLRVCAGKLCDGGSLVIEAPSAFPVHAVNGHAPDGSEWAYPLSPEALRFVCLASGFEDPEIISLGTTGPEERLEELDIWGVDTTLEPWQLEVFNTINSNFQRIADALSRHEDYALAMRRGARGKDKRELPAALGDSV